MNSRLTSGLAGIVLLGLVAAPVAAAAPPAPQSPATTEEPKGANTPAATPSSAYGYAFEREWLYSGNVTDDVWAVAASPRDEVFVAGKDGKVRRYNLSGTLTHSWDLPFDVQALELAVAPNGDLHAAEWGSVAANLPGSILVYSRDGAPKAQYTTPAEFTWTGGIAIDADGGSYLTNTRDNRVHRFSPTGVHLGSFGGEGTGAGKFDDPDGIAIGKDGSLYVSDLGNDRVQQFTKDGSFVRAWGQAGYGDGQFMSPSAIAVAPSGNVFVADVFSARVQEFTPTGSYVRTIEHGKLRKNRDLSFDRHGALYVGGYLESLVQGVAKFVPAQPTGKKTTITAKAQKKTYGKTSKVAITVSKKATGIVTVKAGTTTVTGKLKAGKATVRLPKKALKPGKRTITVSYAGVPGTFRPSSTTAKVRVLKAKPSIKVKAKKKSVTRGRSATLRITVTAPGTTVRGKVTVKAAGAKATTVKLSSKGRATVTLKFAKKAKAGKRTVSVTFRGTSLVQKTTVKKKNLVTVRR
ncbi:MAG: NHL repeat-containing protein [Actinomycetota bacterium]|nr:NHL repeat-containing protein [Actinomycetota bacterium]